MSDNIIDKAVIILPWGNKILIEKFSHKIVIWLVDSNNESMNPDEVTTTDDIGGVFGDLLCALSEISHI